MDSMPAPRKVALVHDWLTSIAGGEKVLQAIYEIYPGLLHTLISDPKKLVGSIFEETSIQTSFIQKLPFSNRKFRTYLPLFPLAIEQFDLRSFDLILSSSHCVAKGVLSHSGQLHICYCHTPVRYAWDLSAEYLQDANLTKGIKGMFARMVLHYLRGWDVSSSHRVDHFIACSKYIARRIHKTYGRDAAIIYPPVDTAFFQPGSNREDYYLAASRLVSYKKIDLIVEAFSLLPNKKLIVIGDGPELKKIKEKATKNVEILGHQNNDQLRSYLQKAKAFVFAAQEDFGIMPVEAMACGTPVIALGKGGAKETILENKTGIFFSEQTPVQLIEAIKRFEEKEWDPDSIRTRAEIFGKERFKKEYASFVDMKYAEFADR
jgi:glycosyltransferase involved in cell wall biosynthesis